MCIGPRGHIILAQRGKITKENYKVMAVSVVVEKIGHKKKKL